MGKEIERKFLVSFLPEGMSGITMRQGYLQPEKERAVRLRTCLLYTSPSPRDVEESRMPSSA